jgi:hypothetical protein
MAAEQFDLFFAVGSVMFSLLLVPIIFKRDSRVPRWSSIPSSLLLLAYAGAYYLLGFDLSVGASLMGAFAWLYIAKNRAMRHYETALEAHE